MSHTYASRHNNAVLVYIFFRIDEVQILRTNYPKMTSFWCMRRNVKSDKFFNLQIFHNTVSLLYKYLSIDNVNTDNSAVNPIDIVSFERHVVVLAVFGCNTNNYMTHRQTLPRGAELNES